MAIDRVIFDWKRTLYDPEKDALTDGAREVVESIYDRGLGLYLVGKDTDGSMPAKLEKFGLGKLFTATHFVPERKIENDFLQYMDLANPHKTAIVGDRVRSEIEVGNLVGAVTIHLCVGKFSTEVPESQGQMPDHTIYSLPEVLPIIFYDPQT